MTGRPSVRLLELYQIAVGLMDTSTGILLIAAPLPTLHLMGITQPPKPEVFIAFVGFFVLGVGLTYLWCLLRFRRGLGSSLEWQTQWRNTALIRACVALGLLAQIARGHMEFAWGSVVLTDAAVALVQWIGLHRGWLCYESRRA